MFLYQLSYPNNILSTYYKQCSSLHQTPSWLKEIRKMNMQYLFLAIFLLKFLHSPVNARYLLIELEEKENATSSGTSRTIGTSKKSITLAKYRFYQIRCVIFHYKIICVSIMLQFGLSPTDLYARLSLEEPHVLILIVIGVYLVFGGMLPWLTPAAWIAARYTTHSTRTIEHFFSIHIQLLNMSSCTKNHQSNSMILFLTGLPIFSVD